MPIHDNFGIRMKTFYEEIPKTKLMRRCPVIIRIDGRSFHTFTKGFDKPFDELLIKAMQETMKYLCENIQGCVLGYTQSDEITLVLVDYKKLNSSAWFDYEVQKMCSIAASMATMAFNKFFEKPVDKCAMFDARCFNIPKEEVTNLIYWRQLDAVRNSIQMVGQSNFPYKELHKKTCNNILEMLLVQKGIDWNELPVYQKRGSCCIKIEGEQNRDGISTGGWIIDKEIPIFKEEGREYIDRLIYVGEQ